MHNQLRPYQGKEPYIFASYAYKSSSIVAPILRGLQSREFRVWYDDGLSAGVNWAEMIADRLSGSGCVLVMVTKEYVNSRSCISELRFAMESELPVLVVFLEELEIPANIRMMISCIQTMFYYRYPNLEAFMQQLCGAAVLQSCRGATPAQAYAQTMEALRAEQGKKAGYAFISYCTKNQKEADHLRTLANQQNITTWMAPYDIPAGSKYAAEITRAIRECACFVLVLSNASQSSDAVDREVEMAALTFKKPLVILQIEPVELNDSFFFYLHNQQIVSVPDITRDTPERAKVIRSMIQNTRQSES